MNNFLANRLEGIKGNKAQRTLRACPNCGTRFEVYKKLYGKKKGEINQKFCSRKCAAASFIKKKNFSCEECGAKFLLTPAQEKRRIFINGKYFCSLKCSTKYKIKSKTPLIEFKNENVLLICPQCKKKFKRLQQEYLRGLKRNNKNFFCSKTCMIEFKKSSNRRLYYGRLWLKMGNLTRIRDNNTCQRCNKHQTNPALSVHHITPIRRFINPDDGNVLENLITLCNKCHSYVERTKIDFELKFEPAKFDDKYLTDSYRPLIYNKEPSSEQKDHSLSLFRGVMRLVKTSSNHYKLTRWRKDLPDPSSYKEKVSRKGIKLNITKSPVHLSELQKQEIKNQKYYRGIYNDLGRKYNVVPNTIKRLINDK